MKKKKLIRELYGNGHFELKCPHCKNTLFSGYYLGITIHNEEECWYCNKPIDMSDFFKEEDKK